MPKTAMTREELLHHVEDLAEQIGAGRTSEVAARHWLAGRGLDEGQVIAALALGVEAGRLIKGDGCYAVLS